jgi:hypothetical protein
LLKQEFSVELLELKVTLDEDPKSTEFGAIKNMVVVASEKMSNSISAADGPVEEIRISVKRGDKESELELENKNSGAELPTFSSKEMGMANFLARYFLLNEEQVEVRLIP